jgi:hypothetical protein
LAGAGFFGPQQTKCGEGVAKGVDDGADADGEDAAGEPDGLPQEALRSARRRTPTALMPIKRITPR